MLLLDLDSCYHLVGWGLYYLYKYNIYIDISYDMHHCDIVSSRSSPSHFTKDSPFNMILPKSEPGQLQKN